MRMIHATFLLGRLLLGLVWSGLLVIAGLAVLSGVAGWSDPGPAAMWLGAGCIAAGTLVFLFVVADRVCPVARRGPIDVLELTIAGVMILLFLKALLAWLGG